MLEHYYGFSMYTAPGPPSNVKGLCTVVLWAQPSQPNGKIRGYEVQKSIFLMNGMAQYIPRRKVTTIT